MGNRPNQHGRRDFAFSSDTKWIIGGFFRRFFCKVRSRAPTVAARSRSSRGEVTKQCRASRGNHRKTEPAEFRPRHALLFKVNRSSPTTMCSQRSLEQWVA